MLHESELARTDPDPHADLAADVPDRYHDPEDSSHGGWTQVVSRLPIRQTDGVLHALFAMMPSCFRITTLPVDCVRRRSGCPAVRFRGGSGRCCTNRDWPARCQSTRSSPADAIRHWSTEGGHPIEDLTAEDDLTPQLASALPGGPPGRCCMNRDWPARCPPTGFSPDDAI